MAKKKERRRFWRKLPKSTKENGPLVSNYRNLKSKSREFRSTIYLYLLRCASRRWYKLSHGKHFTFTFTFIYPKINTKSCSRSDILRLSMLSARRYLIFLKLCLKQLLRFQLLITGNKSQKFMGGFEVKSCNLSLIYCEISAVMAAEFIQQKAINFFR